MSLLLDTHIVLWWLEDNPTLADDLKDRIDRERPDTQVRRRHPARLTTPAKTRENRKRRHPDGRRR
jgi:hypothetical protein